MVPLSGTGTFSLIGRDPKSDAMGVVVATAAHSVGGRVPHAEYGVGSVATQARTDIRYGREGLALLRTGLDARTTILTLVHDDPSAATRQVALMDWRGNSAVHEGASVTEPRRHVQGEDCVAIGNTLAASDVVDAMVAAFEASRRRSEALADCLLNALRGGQSVGGDRRGATSAALLVVSASDNDGLGDINVRVDDHPSPVAELERLLHGYLSWRTTYVSNLSPASRNSEHR